MGRTTSLIDAVVADLTTYVDGWPQSFNQRLYAEPLLVTPQLCPLLAVYAKRLPREIIATINTYARKPQIEIAWYQSSTVGAETGGSMDDKTAAEMLDMIEAIADRCEAYAQGVPGLATAPNGTFADVTDIEVAEEKGLCWRAFVTLEAWQA